ncbi:hypothetical protein QWY93_04250 [Echinicola jeungdonensis]|uniref:Uncharacterized protein n=1 Tax=Echinicola jeungdonensis TaxID=709343 RepID=A0ABV5J1J6_9BACT|nr:hypothetical protein [Echinicola jeungdonensis]MDN3668534.1 hypothetical protein [Echinicola jeungdonensis]
MKKLIIYHIVAILPMMIVMQLFVFDYIDWINFSEMFFIYFFIYRPVVDYKRLKSKGLVNWKQYVRTWGFIRFKYYQELLFEK